MRAKQTIVWIALVVFVSLGLFAGSGDKGKKKQMTPSLEFFKELTGEWVERDQDGNPGSTVVASYEVIGNGSAVSEKLFPGTGHEMLTVYTMESDQLVLTHYCVEGNQPRMQARRGDSASQIVFEHVRGSGMGSEDDQHMHRGMITRVSDNRIQTEWLRFKAGEQNYTAAYDLVRKPRQGQ